MQAYEILNQLLIEAGVETTFQYMAEDNMNQVADLMTREDSPIEVVHTRHEQGAMAMADGYARAGDRIGVCILSRGPGIAQTGTALVNAQKNGSRLLVIVPLPANTDRHDPKTFKQDLYLESTAGNVVTVRSEGNLISTTKEAIRSVHFGDSPLVLQLPKDVLNATMDVSPDALSFREEHDGVGVPLAKSRPSAPPASPERSKIEAAVDMYLDSDAFQPPVILAGEGAVSADAKEPIERLAERLNAVLVTSLKGRGYFGDHPFALGFSGNWGSPLANEFLTEASYVLAVGCSLNHHTVDDGYLIDEDATVVHVDTDPERIGQYTPVDLGIVGDARVTVEALLEEVETAGIDRGQELWTDSLRERIADYSPLDLKEFPEKPDVMDPRDTIRKLEEVLPDGRFVTSDGGQFRRWALHEITAPPADSSMGCDFATIGLGLPMGIGLGQFIRDRNRTGTDERTPITICGDGGFMMSLQELETAVRYDIPIVVIVGNDMSLGSEYHFLEAEGGPADVARLSTPSIAAVAESMGAEGYAATSVGEIEEVAEKLQNPDGPVVLECRIDHEVQHHWVR